MTHRRGSFGANPRKLALESLEQRDLLAGHGFAAFQDFSRAAFADSFSHKNNEPLANLELVEE